MPTKKKVLVRTQNDTLPEDARQYVSLKQTHAELAGRIKDLRDRLVSAVERRGYDTDGGHQLLDLPDDVAETLGVRRFKRERRVKQSFREDELVAFLKEKGLYDDVVVLVPSIDGDALAAAVFEGKVSEAELNSFVDETVTYALTMEKK